MQEKAEWSERSCERADAPSSDAPHTNHTYTPIRCPTHQLAESLPQHLRHFPNSIYQSLHPSLWWSLPCCNVFAPAILYGLPIFSCVQFWACWHELDHRGMRSKHTKRKMHHASHSRRITMKHWRTDQWRSLLVVFFLVFEALKGSVNHNKVAPFERFVQSPCLLFQRVITSSDTLRPKNKSMHK